MFVQELTDLVRTSGAYSNFFFDACKQCTSIPIERLEWLARNWYEVTSNFGLRLTSYVVVLAERVLYESNPDRRRAYERAFFEAAKISSHDLGLGLTKIGNPQGVKGIHYNLWVDMVSPILNRSALEDPNHPRVISATHGISREFWHGFASPAGGAAVLRVVEEIAYHIVEAMLPLFLAAERNGHKVFTIEDLTYITPHLKIEREHARQSSDIVELILEADPTAHQNILNGVTRLSKKFADFWWAMNHRTFN